MPLSCWAKVSSRCAKLIWASLTSTIVSTCVATSIDQDRNCLVSPDLFTQVLGYLAFFQATVPLMQAGGKFIFLSSGSATVDQVPRGYEVTYGISKVRLPPISS